MKNTYSPLIKVLKIFKIRVLFLGRIKWHSMDYSELRSIY